MNVVYARDLLEVLNQYTIEELKKIRVFVNNETFDNINLERHDSFKVQDIEVDEDLKVLYLEI